jgi:hypothetical protein
MFDKIKKAVIPHIIGFIFLISGWLLCIVDVGINRFSSKGIFDPVTLAGLVLILVGAYMPDTLIAIRNSSKKKDQENK